MRLTFSGHALVRMRERGIAASEVRQALANVTDERPGTRPGRVNVWGVTWSGRRLRITTYVDRRDYVITVVASDEEA